MAEPYIAPLELADYSADFSERLRVAQISVGDICNLNLQLPPSTSPDTPAFRFTTRIKSSEVWNKVSIQLIELDVLDANYEPLDDVRSLSFHLCNGILTPPRRAQPGQWLSIAKLCNSGSIEQGYLSRWSLPDAVFDDLLRRYPKPMTTD